jgi:hypothetical protein
MLQSFRMWLMPRVFIWCRFFCNKLCISPPASFHHDVWSILALKLDVVSQCLSTLDESMSCLYGVLLPIIGEKPSGWVLERRGRLLSLMPMISPRMTGSSIIGRIHRCKGKKSDQWKLFNLVPSLVFKSCITELVLTCGMQNLHQAFNKNCGIFYVSCSHFT